MRPIELVTLTKRDYDNKRGTIKIPETKKCNPRIVELDNKTLATFNNYIAKYGFNFLNSKKLRRGWTYVRNKAFEMYGEPLIKLIRLYDLRHWFATVLYHKTKDILYVKQQLGHKKIETTLIYTHLVNFKSDDWTSAVATTVEETCTLIETGFEFV